MTMRKLPIGIQGFEKLRTENFVYVDKTEYIYELAHNNTPYFLSRPRRFGKSLLLSAMRAYWEGRRELFEGLAVERLEAGNPEAWKTYPVFYFDFNGKNYQKDGALEELLDGLLRDWEDRYGGQDRTRPLEERFGKLLERAHGGTGLRCVVLIDEYDKPLLDLVEKKDLQGHNRDVLKGFFSLLKSQDEHIQFIFITGVTKFHKVSIFSDLNQLRDISLNQKYAGLCGITEAELEKCFEAELAAFARQHDISVQECRKLLRDMYDGYRFHPYGVSVYNPLSLLNAFADGECGSYWFETGTPTYLIRRLRESRFELKRLLDQTLYASEGMLKDYTGDTLELIPLLYQTGYLTISDYDERRRRYTLCFPNNEVKYGFVESLIPSFVPQAVSGNGLDIFTMDEYVEKGDLDGIRSVLTGLFANIAYTRQEDPFEHYFQSVIFIVFTMLGKFVRCEQHTFSGRIDCILETEKYIYLFEFKRDDTAEAALKQIDDMKYALAYAADSRQLFRIGVAFDSEKRILSGWKAALGKADPS